MALVWSHTRESCRDAGTALHGRPCSYLGEEACGSLGLIDMITGEAAYTKLICVDDGYTPPPRPKDGGKFMLDGSEIVTSRYKNLNKSQITTQPIDSRIVGGWMDDKLLYKEFAKHTYDDIGSATLIDSRIEYLDNKMLYIRRDVIINPFGMNSKNKITLDAGSITADDLLAKIPKDNIRSHNASSKESIDALIITQAGGGGGAGGYLYGSNDGSGGGGAGGTSSSICNIVNTTDYITHFYVGHGGSGGAAKRPGTKGSDTYALLKDKYGDIMITYGLAYGGQGGMVATGGAGGSISSSTDDIKYNFYADGGNGGGARTNGSSSSVKENSISSSKFLGSTISKSTSNSNLSTGSSYGGGSHGGDGNRGNGGGGGSSRFGTGGNGSDSPTSGGIGAGGGGATSRVWDSWLKPGGKGGDGRMYIYF